jgi:uncharacterized protein YndB with AHSA1/START domain
MAKTDSYVLERDFDAPCELVWRGWTEADLLARWYGPNVETITHRLEVKPKGLWLVEMKWGGNSSYQRAEFLEVQQPSRLVMLLSSADSNWTIAPSPMMPDWPRTLHTEVTLQAIGNKTRMRLTWKPHEATAAETACFSAALDRMGKGWESGMEKLAALLAEL